MTRSLILVVLLSACSDQQFVRLDLGRTAVVTGDYDIIEDILDGLGTDLTLNYDLLDGYMTGPFDYDPNHTPTDSFDGERARQPQGNAWDVLNDQAALNQYDTLFLNCGLKTIDPLTYDATDPNNSANLISGNIADNLRGFVDDGGSLYASDWAYLAVEEAWPNMIDFYPPNPPDTDKKFLHPSEGPSRGWATGVDNDFPLVDALVTAPALKEELGKDRVELHYDLYQWIVISGVDDAVDTYIRGDVYVINEAGNARGAKLTNRPLLVGFEYGKGHVFYTTFHNESPGTDLQNTNEDVYGILNFLVFQFNRAPAS